MPKEHTPEQFWKLYKKLPQELKDAIFAEETGDSIYEICKKYGLTDAIETVVDYVGNVLLGLLPPDDFQNLIEIELKLEKETARKIAHEISRFVFYPVKPVLEQLYGAERTGGEGMPAEKIEQKPKKTAGEDRYRETIE